MEHLFFFPFPWLVTDRERASLGGGLQPPIWSSAPPADCAGTPRHMLRAQAYAGRTNLTPHTLPVFLLSFLFPSFLISWFFSVYFSFFSCLLLVSSSWFPCKSHLSSETSLPSPAGRRPLLCISTVALPSLHHRTLHTVIGCPSPTPATMYCFLENQILHFQGSTNAFFTDKTQDYSNFDFTHGTLNKNITKMCF